VTLQKFWFLQTLYNGDYAADEGLNISAFIVPSSQDAKILILALPSMPPFCWSVFPYINNMVASPC